MTTPVHSYGTIPVTTTATGWRYLLIHMYGSGGGTHWSFPKGRPEAGESPLEVAVRETREETGLVPVRVDESTLFTQQYEFTSLANEHIKKTVTYFVAHVEQTELSLQVEEVKEARWLPYQSARELLTHEQSKEMLDEVEVYLQQTAESGEAK